MLRSALTATGSCLLVLCGFVACTSRLDLGHDLQSSVTAPGNSFDAGTDADAASEPDASDASDAAPGDASPIDAASDAGPTCVGIPCFAGPPAILATSPGSARGLVVDADDIFWAAPTSDALMVTPKDGSPTMTNSTPMAGPFRVAADDTNVYFTSTAGGYVGTAPKSASGRLSPRNPPPITLLATDEAQPQSLVVGSEGVYFTDNQAGTLRRVTLDHSVIETVVSGLSAGTELALDSDSVYYADSTVGEIHAVARGTLVDTRLAKNLARPVAPVPRGDNLYFLELGDTANAGQLVSMPRAGGAIHLVADHLESPTGLAADTGALYVCTRGSAPDFKGQILRFADDGQVNVLATDQAEPFAIAVDGDGVYWTTDADSALHSIAR